MEYKWPTLGAIKIVRRWRRKCENLNIMNEVVTVIIVIYFIFTAIYLSINRESFMQTISNYYFVDETLLSGRFDTI